MIALGLILLLAAELVGVVWWRLYQSPRRKDARERGRRRKKDLAASISRQAAAAAETSGER